MELMNVKGTTDSLPKKEVIKRRTINTLTDTFEKFGYLPLDTTILCYYDLLASKYSGGSEILKEVYTLKDQGDRDLGLRYDLTVPFSKVISMNAGKEITLPFKRYEVGKVFRDGPVKTGRAREFYQCDVDVCGIAGSYIEAEMLSMTVLAYKRLGIDIYIEVNNRKLLQGFIMAAGIPEELASKVILSVDKLAKIGENGVKKELEEYNIEEEKLNKLFSYFKCSIDELDNMNITNEYFAQGKEEIKELFGYLRELSLDECKFTPYLARGLEIYTGTVWEVFDEKQRLTCAIGGGGRYDKIITNFINDGNVYPAVGISFGIVPICEILSTSEEKSLYDLLIIPMDTNTECLKLANSLREKGIRVLIEMNKRKIKKVLESADKNGIPYVIILGENEINEKILEVKDMKNSTNIKVELNDIEKICNIIEKR